MSFTEIWRRHDFGDIVRRIASKTPAEVRRALGRPRGSVDLEDFAALLSPAAAPFLEDMAQAAHHNTVERFGRTMRLYAPKTAALDGTWAPPPVTRVDSGGGRKN